MRAHCAPSRPWCPVAHLTHSPLRAWGLRALLEPGRPVAGCAVLWVGFGLAAVYQSHMRFGGDRPARITEYLYPPQPALASALQFATRCSTSFLY